MDNVIGLEEYRKNKNYDSIKKRILDSTSVKNSMNRPINYLKKTLGTFKITKGINKRINPYIYKYLAGRNIKKERYEKASTYLEKLINIDNNILGFHLELSYCYNNMGKYDENIKNLKEARKIDAFNPLIYYDFAEIYLNLFEDDLALQSLLKAKRLVDNQDYFERGLKIDIDKFLLELYYDNQEWSKAIELGEKLVNNGVIDEPISFVLGTSYKMAHQFDKAIYWFLRSHYIFNKNQGVILNLVELYSNKGRFEDAFNLLEESIKNFDVNSKEYKLLSKELNNITKNIAKNNLSLVR